MTLDDKLVAGTDSVVDVLALDEALTRLAGMDERMAQVVEFHVFAGMTVAEAACVLDVSKRTVERDWRMAKMWLLDELSEGNNR